MAGSRRKTDDEDAFDRELADLPADLRWREWMNRVEAVIFAAAEPVPRAVLAPLVGVGCNLDLIIDDIRAELQARPYDLVAVAGGWRHLTRPAYAGAIRSTVPTRPGRADLSAAEGLVLMAIACFQPMTRADLAAVLGRSVSRDLIGGLRRQGFIAAGPRAPQPGAPYTYVTTPAFLRHFGLTSLRDLPDIEALEDAGLLSRDRMRQDGFAPPSEEDGPD
ncbi:segregation and condensation protein B [Rhodobacteraceae bacterium MBR-64]